MENRAPSFFSLLRRGGIYYNAPGSVPEDLLRWLIQTVPAADIDKDALLKAVLEREDLMPTAMGNGIALPHPRNPILEREEAQIAALAFLENGIDWGALDGRAVDTVILVVSASARIHLSMLQRITFFCRDGGFCALLQRRAPAEEIFDYIERGEKSWK
ncbi:MAG: PTS sugar transporter subunit IIA [Spirochaetaceae bacterium]|jgi:PTS system nitrogen regulatory IIA component|nr:PTS sugar transporter subunit IIA [Spirochaetaceae bacterium]